MPVEAEGFMEAIYPSLRVGANRTFRGSPLVPVHNHQVCAIINPIFPASPRSPSRISRGGQRRR
jgi:hypothetical protein